MRQFEDLGVESLCLTWMESGCEIIVYYVGMQQE